MIKLLKNDPRPLYEQVRETLRQKIASGALAAGAALPEERVFAADLGISRMTVRRAISDLAGDGLIDRIRGRGTFVRAHAAARMPPAESTVLRELLIVSTFDRTEMRAALFYQHILDGIESAVPAGAEIVVRTAARCREPLVAQAARDAGGLGLIVLGILDERLLGLAADAGVPTVLVDSAQPRGRVLDQVLHEDLASATGAVSALIDLGHRAIDLVNYPATPAAESRQRGYAAALTAHGIPVEPERIHTVSCNATAGYARMRAVLAGPRPPTAVFCTTDDLALGVIAAVKDHGWQVPGDVSVVGFGDDGSFSAPPLTTVRIPTQSLGATAVRLLTERLADPALPPRAVVLPTELIRRGSCAVAPADT